MTVILRCLVVALSVGVLPQTLAAEQSSALSGTVVDQSGLALPGVTVHVVAGDRATRRQTVTDGIGRFAFDALPTGRYELTFSAMNFADVRRKDVSVSPGTPVRVDVTMLLAVNASVVVTAYNTFRNLAELDRPEENLVGVALAASEGAVTARQLAARPILRAAEVLETVPGVIASQHSGEGKANQYYLRGFNLDHGTDFATTVAGLPVNLPTHAHGQGYTDLNFLIPELVSGVQFRKGPYYASDGDFAAAGSANINYVTALPQSILGVSSGQGGWSRVLAAASPRLGTGTLLGAIEFGKNDGPWTRPDNYRRVNGVLRYSRGDVRNALSVTALAYAGTWDATDQIPARAVTDGRLSRFDGIDSTGGGRSARYSVIGDYQRDTGRDLTRASIFLSRYQLNLFSNFTYGLDDPDRGDQFEQADRRWIAGGRATRTRLTEWFGRRGETTVGMTVRHDNAPLVGLFRTERRARHTTVREDAVDQTSVGVFAESELRWMSWLRTTTGVRMDAYRFEVHSNLSENSGVSTSQIVSPKGGIILGPWRQTEFYVNAGTGFHSNDARGSTITVDPSTGEDADRVTPLVGARGAELGLRTVLIPRVQSTVALWRLDLDSELLFVGDAGTTDAGRPSTRHGVEWTNYVQLSRRFTIDADLAWSHARFSDEAALGAAIPGSAQTVASVGLTATADRGLFGSARWRYFGPRPLVEDSSIRSGATGLLNAELGYHLTPRLHLVLDAFNVLNGRASDVDYYYTSRLPDEPAGGVEDIHTHPALPRTFRVILRASF